MKFSSNDNTIKIKCKLIVVKEDLTDSNMVEKFNKCKHGMVEISVEDKGIGIKKED